MARPTKEELAAERTQWLDQSRDWLEGIDEVLEESTPTESKEQPRKRQRAKKNLSPVIPEQVASEFEKRSIKTEVK